MCKHESHRKVVDPRGQVVDVLAGRAQLLALALQLVLHLVQCLHHVLLLLGLGLALPLLALQLGHQLCVIYTRMQMILRFNRHFQK